MGAERGILVCNGKPPMCCSSCFSGDSLESSTQDDGRLGDQRCCCPIKLYTSAGSSQDVLIARRTGAQGGPAPSKAHQARSSALGASGGPPPLPSPRPLLAMDHCRRPADRATAVIRRPAVIASVRAFWGRNGCSE